MAVVECFLGVSGSAVRLALQPGPFFVAEFLDRGGAVKVLEFEVVTMLYDGKVRLQPSVRRKANQPGS